MQKGSERPWSAGIVALLMLAIFALALSVPLRAHAKEAAPDLTYRKKGFYLGAGLAGLVGFSGGGVYGAPGKVGLLVGYQINPYVSVGADLWTFLFLAYAAEAHVKANFRDAKISPYAVGTAGVVGVLNVWDDDVDDAGDAMLTYSAGLGVDFHLWKKATLFTELRYRGGTGDAGFNGTINGMEAGLGFRWTF